MGPAFLNRTWLVFVSGFASAVMLLALAGGGVLAYEYFARAQGPIVTPARAPLGDYGDQKVVYHVATKGTWRDRESEAWRLVAVVNNHLNAVEPNEAEIRLLFQGDGIDALKRAKTNPKLAAAFEGLKKRGVKFRICTNTLEAYKLGLETLWDAREDELVQAAVAELIHLQKQGFGYIRF